MKVIIHAGAFKTATSSLQTYLHSRREALIRDHGVLYPEAGSRRNFGSLSEHSLSHNLLFKASKSDEKELRRIVPALLTEVRETGATSILVSAETLSLTREEDKRRFVSVFHALNASEFRVVYAVRHFADFAESMANQILKNPFKDLGEVNYDGRGLVRDLQEWRRVVGADKLTTIYFDGSRYVEFCEELLECLGLPGDARELAAVSDNTSVSLNSMQATAMLNALMRESGADLNKSARDVLRRALTSLENNWDRRKRAIALTPDRATELHEFFVAKRENFVKFFTPRSLERYDADILRRSGAASRERNIDNPETFTRDDLLKLVIFTHEIPEVAALVRKIIVDRAPPNGGRL